MAYARPMRIITGAVGCVVFFLLLVVPLLPPATESLTARLPQAPQLAWG
jgi:type II secretory pathway component PulF